MPDLQIYEVMGDDGFLGIEIKDIPRVANEIAAVLAKEDFKLRSCSAALAHVLGWLAYQIKEQGSSPEDFMAAVTEQSLNYCHEFSRLPDMTSDTSYRCWTVACPECKTVIFLDIIAPYDGLVKIPIVPRCRQFELTCPACQAEHRYSSTDLKDLILLNPPLGTYCRQFRDALESDDT